jgi:hypothetical protein
MALEDKTTVEFDVEVNTDKMAPGLKQVNDKLLEAQKNTRLDLIIMTSEAQDKLAKIRQQLKTARGDAKIDLRIQQADAKKQLDELNKQIKEVDKNIKSIETTGKAVERTMIKTAKTGKASWLEWFSIISLIQKGFRALKKSMDFANEFKDAQRDAIETKNKFGEIYKTIRVEAELTAQSVAKNFGLADTSAREMIGSTGDFLKGLKLTEQQSLSWSKRVVEMSGDLTSFKNVQGGIPRTMAAVQKAMLGQTRMLKEAINTSILKTEIDEKAKEVMKEQTDLTLKQAKAYAVLELITERNKDAVGDFNRTRADLANKERILEERYKTLSETIGKDVVPAFDLWIDAQNLILDLNMGDEMNMINKKAIEQMDVFHKLSARVRILSENQNRSQIEQNEYVKALDKIKAQYPEYLGQLSSELSTHEEIVEALRLQRDYQKDKIFEFALDEKRKELARLELNMTVEKLMLEEESLVIKENMKDEDFKRGKGMQELVEYSGQAVTYDRQAKALSKDIAENIEKQQEMERLHLKAVETINKKHKERLELLAKQKKEQQELDKLKEQAEQVAFLNSAYYKLAKSLLDTADSMQKIRSDAAKLLREYESGKITMEEFVEAMKGIKSRSEELEAATQRSVDRNYDLLDSIYALVPAGSQLEKRIEDLMNEFEEGEITSEEFIKSVQNLKKELQNIPKFKLEVEKPDILEDDPYEHLPDDIAVLRKKKDLYDQEVAYQKELREIGWQDEEKYQKSLVELAEKYGIEKNDKRKKTETDHVELINQTQSAIFSTISQWTNRDITKIESKYSAEEQALADQFENGEIMREEYEDAMKKLDLKAEKEKRKILIRQQKWDVASAIANSAVAITKVFATTPPPYSFILAGLTALQTALQVQTVLAQKFREGGLLKGASHEQGGIKGVIKGSNTQIEVEGGEFINKKEVVMYPRTRDLANFTNTFHNGASIPNSKKIKTVSMLYEDGSRFRLGQNHKSVKPLSNYFQEGGLAGDINLNGQRNPSEPGVSLEQLDYIASKLSVSAEISSEVNMDKIAYAVTVKQNKMKNDGTDLSQTG